jgi:AcrR family transcriptional regulator
VRVVSTPYEAAGRTNQKRRTRDSLVAAARALVTAGETPTVEQAAARAQVSRTTAYRYFPSQRDLLVAAHPEVAAGSLLPEPPPADPEARLAAVIDSFTQIVLDSEPQQRTMLRLSLDGSPSGEPRADLPLRQGRAIGWIEEALAPLQGRLSAAEVHQLALAIRSAVGIEALVWLTDVGGLSQVEAAQLMRWSALGLLRAAAAGDPPPVD